MPVSGIGRGEDTIVPYDKLIRTASVSSEQPILMVSTNRWDYMNKYLPDFQDMISFEIYMYILAAIGIVLLLAGNVLAIVFLAGAGYFYPQYQHRKGQVTSKRRVMLGN